MFLITYIFITLSLILNASEINPDNNFFEKLPTDQAGREYLFIIFCDLIHHHRLNFRPRMILRMIRRCSYHLKKSLNFFEQERYSSVKSLQDGCKKVKNFLKG